MNPKMKRECSLCHKQKETVKRRWSYNGQRVCSDCVTVDIRRNRTANLKGVDDKTLSYYIDNEVKQQLGNLINLFEELEGEKR